MKHPLFLSLLLLSSTCPAFSAFSAHARQVAAGDGCGRQVGEIIVKDSLRERESSFICSENSIVKQDSSRYAPTLLYIQRLDMLYSVSFPIELVVQNTTEKNASIMSMGYYYRVGHNNIKKKWWSNLAIYEKTKDSLVWIGDERTILEIAPSSSKKYIVYTEHFVNKDATFQKHFKPLMQKMKTEERKRVDIDVQQCSEKQINYLRKMIEKDSIKINVYFNDNRHRVALPIDAQKVIKKTKNGIMKHPLILSLLLLSSTCPAFSAHARQVAAGDGCGRQTGEVMVVESLREEENMEIETPMRIPLKEEKCYPAILLDGIAIKPTRFYTYPPSWNNRPSKVGLALEVTAPNNVYVTYLDYRMENDKQYNDYPRAIGKYLLTLDIRGDSVDLLIDTLRFGDTFVLDEQWRNHKQEIKIGRLSIAYEFGFTAEIINPDFTFGGYEIIHLFRLSANGEEEVVDFRYVSTRKEDNVNSIEWKGYRVEVLDDLSEPLRMRVRKK